MFSSLRHRFSALRDVTLGSSLRAAGFGALVLYGVNFVALGFLIGPEDYDHLSSYYELALHFWRSPGLPHYNPFFCGGRTLGGDPQIPIFSPVLLPVAIFGPVWTIRFELLAQLALGLWGLNKIFRRLGLDSQARSWGLLLFALGGGVTARMMVGHVTLGFLLLLPLFFYLSYELQDRWTARGFFQYVALFIYSALYKPNFFLVAIPILGTEALARSLWSRSVRPLLFMGGASAISAAGLAAIYLPTWHYFGSYPRLTPDSGLKAVPLYTFFANILFPLKAVPEKFYGPIFLMRHEYNHYLSPLGIFLSWIGIRELVKRKFSREVSAILGPLSILAVVCVVLGMGGDNEAPSIYTFFYRYWPGFASMRVPVRFWFGTGLVLVVFSAVGFQRYRGRLKVSIVIWLGLLPLFIPAAINLSKTTAWSRGHQWEAARKTGAPTEWVKGDVKRMYPPIRSGRGILDCVTNVEAWIAPGVKEGPIRAGLQSVEITWNGWSEIKLKGSGSPGSVFTIPFNHHPQWTSETSLEIVSHRGEPLTFRIGASPFESTIRYTQPLLREGFWISLATLSVLALIALVLKLARS